MTVMKFSKRTLTQNLPYILIIAGVIGYICTSVLLFDKMALLKDPNYIPSCNVNPVLSCGSVMLSEQGQIFSTPSTYVGFGVYAALATIGIAMLAGAIFKKWFWYGLQLGVTLGLLGVMALFIDSVYFIKALCPFCMVIWVCTITAFWYVTMYNYDQKLLRFPKGKATSAANWIRKHHLDLLILVFLLIAGLILNHFWYYYGQYFPFG